MDGDFLLSLIIILLMWAPWSIFTVAMAMFLFRDTFRR